MGEVSNEPIRRRCPSREEIKEENSKQVTSGKRVPLAGIGKEKFSAVLIERAGKECHQLRKKASTPYESLAMGGMLASIS